MLGLTIGSLAGPNSAPATVNMIYMPMAFCGGLWIPFDFLPKAIQQAAPLLALVPPGADRAGHHRTRRYGARLAGMRRRWQAFEA